MVQLGMQLSTFSNGFKAIIIKSGVNSLRVAIETRTSWGQYLECHLDLLRTLPDTISNREDRAGRTLCRDKDHAVYT